MNEVVFNHLILLCFNNKQYSLKNETRLHHRRNDSIYQK